MTENRRFTAGETIEILTGQGFKITAQKLRNYEAQGLIRPVIKETKHRLYSAYVIRSIKQILVLLVLDFSIKEINAAFDMGSSQLFEDEMNRRIKLKKKLLMSIPQLMFLNRKK